MGKISLTMMERLPAYLNYLETARDNNIKNISATKIAKDMRLGEVLVRKELSKMSGNGRPHLGYVVNDLINDIEKFIDTNQNTKAVIIGAGKLGRALMGYPGFRKFGVDVIAAFDSDLDKIDSVTIHNISNLKKFVADNDVKIGIITVPKDNADEAYDLLISSKIRAVWNFAPVTLKPVSNVLVKNENLAVSLSYLNMLLKAK